MQKLVTKYLPFVQELSNHYQYDSNITHLLFLIVPAFIYKYGLSQEKMIIHVLQNTKIQIGKQNRSQIEAYYTSIPSYQGTNIITKKFIVLENYSSTSLVQLLDNLVHELNHAIHSYHQEITIKENTLFVRTGLTHTIYRLPDFLPLKKENTYILEEILNTAQTEEIINIIKNYQDPSIEEINNTIYAINNETTISYRSKSYYLETMLFQKILKNKTFSSTLNQLRLSGNIEDIEPWFNHITGLPNSYQILNQHLFSIMELENTLIQKKHFKNKTINQIQKLVTKTIEIIDLFNQNCHYK